MTSESNCGRRAPGGLSPARSDWVRECGKFYWTAGDVPIRRLAITATRSVPAPGDLRAIELPAWAADIGVENGLLVDSTTITPGDDAEWQRCDWIAAAWLHLTGAAERAQEDSAGPVYSYAFRISRYDPRRYDRAWVNRIFLFLRRWAAREAGHSEESLLGPLGAPQIVLTHDVDAIRKTPEIRLKQGILYGWNAARALRQGSRRRAATLAGRAARFMLTPADLRTFAEVRAREEAAGLRSLLHFYGGPPGLRRASPVSLLIDPAYDIGASDMKAELALFQAGGWTIGLHQSTRAWAEAEAMACERRRIESAAGQDVTACRQHWLRFSWRDTWKAQEAAGLKSDSTLGFNDRPGFRNGAALEFRPWDFRTERPLSLVARPMVFMDSHFYDYGQHREHDLADWMTRWLDEIRYVRGCATVNWHTHTITDAYGWGKGYNILMELLAGSGMS